MHTSICTDIKRAREKGERRQLGKRKKPRIRRKNPQILWITPCKKMHKAHAQALHGKCPQEQSRTGIYKTPRPVNDDSEINSDW